MSRGQFSASISQTDPAPERRGLLVNVHGLAVALRCSLPGLRQMMNDLFGELIDKDWPAGFVPIEGSVDSYDPDVVARQISPQAECVSRFGDGAELWRDGERVWLIDESWGICEINLLKSAWKSWMIPEADAEPMRAIEKAILWPMGQILAMRSLAVIQAPSLAHRGRGILVLSPFNLEPELSMYVAAGHGVIGQRWTALRDENGRFLMLHLPGRIERSPIPQLRMRMSAESKSAIVQDNWFDLTCDSNTRCNYAWCGAVLIVEPGRRAMASLRPITGASATAMLKRAWPIPDVNPSARHAKFATMLSNKVPVFQVELSRDPRALMRLLDQIPTESTGRPSLHPTIHVSSLNRVAS